MKLLSWPNCRNHGPFCSTTTTTAPVKKHERSSIREVTPNGAIGMFFAAWFRSGSAFPLPILKSDHLRLSRCRAIADLDWFHADVSRGHFTSGHSSSLASCGPRLRPRTTAGFRLSPGLWSCTAPETAWTVKALDVHLPLPGTGLRWREACSRLASLHSLGLVLTPGASQELPSWLRGWCPSITKIQLTSLSICSSHHVHTHPLTGQERSSTTQRPAKPFP